VAVVGVVVIEQTYWTTSPYCNRNEWCAGIEPPQWDEPQRVPEQLPMPRSASVVVSGSSTIYNQPFTPILPMQQ
jgi:hypothetical protein